VRPSDARLPGRRVFEALPLESVSSVTVATKVRPWPYPVGSAEELANTWMTKDLLAMLLRLNSPSVNGLDGWDCLIVALLFVSRCRSDEGREDFGYGKQ